MKTLYLTKTLLPLLFLPVAPGVLQLELARQGLMTGNWAGLVIAAQGIFTLGLIAWLGLSITRQRQKAFLRMSCVSKKVHFQGRWMTVESYLAEQHGIEVSHAMTPEESQAWMADAEEYLRQEIPTIQADQTEPLPDILASSAPRQLQQSAA
jgi:hypothetical protein